MTAVADSGPLISLAIVGQFDVLRRYFSELLIVPEVEREVVSDGKGRPGEAELRAAVANGWARIQPVSQGSVERVRCAHGDVGAISDKSRR